ncbi:MAG: universal stress protein [Actinomycetota bacterium]|nr:universal stress protein [Actinomycetota bacterium]
MHVLIATDGKIDVETASSFAAGLAGPSGRVTVLTVVEVPRAFLHDMRGQWGAMDGVGVIVDDEFVATPAVPQEAPRGWPGDDAVIEHYLADKLDQHTTPIIAALREEGVEAEGSVVESENVTNTILDQLETLGAEVVVIGSHGQGLFQGLLGSTGTKLVRRCPKPVLLIRSATT